MEGRQFLTLKMKVQFLLPGKGGSSIGRTFILGVKGWEFESLPPELYGDNSLMVECYIVTVKMWVRFPFITV
jgi:hypothetical protein